MPPLPDEMSVVRMTGPSRRVLPELLSLSKRTGHGPGTPDGAVGVFTPHDGIAHAHVKSNNARLLASSTGLGMGGDSGLFLPVPGLAGPLLLRHRCRPPGTTVRCKAGAGSAAGR